MGGHAPFSPSQDILRPGASYILEEGMMPDSIDDGIFTAKEISELDMHNVDLAVVSACKSALGEIWRRWSFGIDERF